MSIPRTYARALYETAMADPASSSQTALDQIEKDLSSVAEAVHSSRELSTALNSPILSSKDKAALIENFGQKLGQKLGQTPGLAPLVARFLNLLALKNRMAWLEPIVEEFSHARLSAEGRILGTAVGADAVSDADVAGLASAFGKKLGKTVKFRVSTDPTLLAGMKVSVNGVTYDGTLKSQLDRLRDRFLEKR